MRVPRNSDGRCSEASILVVDCASAMQRAGGGECRAILTGDAVKQAFLVVDCASAMQRAGGGGGGGALQWPTACEGVGGGCRSGVGVCDDDVREDDVHDDEVQTACSPGAGGGGRYPQWRTNRRLWRKERAARVIGGTRRRASTVVSPAVRLLSSNWRSRPPRRA
jgi:hypothetical protein